MIIYNYLKIFFPNKKSQDLVHQLYDFQYGYNLIEPQKYDLMDLIYDDTNI